MIRNILAVVVGLIVGMIFNMCVVLLNTTLYPMPEGVTFEDADGTAAYFAELPVTAFLIVIVAHVGQAVLRRSGCRRDQPQRRDGGGDDRWCVVHDRRDREHDVDAHASLDVD